MFVINKTKQQSPSEYNVPPFTSSDPNARCSPFEKCIIFYDTYTECINGESIIILLGLISLIFL